MKKSTILVAIGIFIIITVFLGVNNKKMYQKQKHFETTDEIVHQLENKPLVILNEKDGISESDDLKECLSERKRLTDSQFHFGKIDIKEVADLSEEEKNEILKEYEDLRNNFTKRRPITKEEVIRLTVDAYYPTYVDQATIKYDQGSKKLNLDLVLVDEGEGLVIDYIKETRKVTLNEEGNKDA